MELPLTPKQKAVLDYISQEIAERGYAPTYREIALRFQLNSTASAYEIVDKLVTGGWLVKHDGRSRGLEVAKPRQSL